MLREISDGKRSLADVESIPYPNIDPFTRMPERYGPPSQMMILHTRLKTRIGRC
jgi:hypothetical protein